MICEKCGNDMADNARFCPACGSTVDEATQPAAPMPQQPVAPMPQQAVTQVKSNVIAGLLNWVWMGAGNIYVGQTTKGIVFCILNLVLIVIDIVTCFFGFLIHTPIMIAMIIDAVIIADRINRGETVDEWKFF